MNCFNYNSKFFNVIYYVSISLSNTF